MPTPHDPRVQTTETRFGIRRRRGRETQRGQIIVLFAGALIALLALCAVVIDVAWYWTSNLRIQRAADAAALAGVVWLPNKPGTAATVAIAEAAKNGFVNGVDGVTITPSVDPANDRRLRVVLSAPVGTFFARVVGVNQWPASRTALADYVLPVPMGSPANYYGVGFFEGLAPHVTTGSSQSTGCGTGSWSTSCTGKVPGSVPSGGQWTTSSGSMLASVQSNNNTYALATTNGQRQEWSAFGLQSGITNPGANQNLVVEGLEVRLTDAFVSASCSNSTIGVEVSWNGGTTWSTALVSPTLGTNTSSGDYILGVNTSTAAWGGHTWTRADFSDANFRVRLTANKGCAAAGTSLRVDMLDVRVTWRLDTTTWSNQTLTVDDPLAGTALASQGFWGAIFTSGGWRENGDKYAPAHIGNGAPGGLSGNDPSPTYDANGYDYTIELPGGSGDVRLFDPIFCATGSNGHGGSFGAGDHWTSGGTSELPVAITYRLYDTHGTLQDLTDDGPPIVTLAYDPGNKSLGDFSGAFGTPSNQGAANAEDCSTNPAHNQWVQMASGLASGSYRLNVNTSLQGANANTGAENLFSIWAHSSGTARVYGGGRMAAYTNLDTGQQKFYFAQIERVHAGKTMVIHLFDPGETNGNAYLRLLSPDGNVYHRQRFDWVSDDGRSGTNVDQIQTSNGSPLFNNKEITITVPLPPSYGQSGLNPPGDITDEPGWWLIEYELANGNDTTTWSVEIRGNPVHLVTP